MAITISLVEILFLLTAGPLARSDQRAFRQLLDHRHLVFSRSPEIRTWLRVFSGKLRRLADLLFIHCFPDQKTFCPGCFDRRRANICQADPCATTNSCAIHGNLSGYADRGEIPDFSFQLKVGASASRRWNRDTDFGQGFRRVQAQW